MQSEVISNAMQRVKNLLDENSFVELDKFVDEGVICGYGTINLRPVCVFSQNSEVAAGAINEKNCEKICNIIDRAVKVGVPIIGFYDSIGAKVDESTGVLVGIEKILVKLSEASGVVPEIAIVSGSAVGISSYAVNFSDFAFMIEKESKMFINGPQAVTSATGKEITSEVLGGAKVHFEKSGDCHFYCLDEYDCINKVKELVSYLPDNNLTDVEFVESDDRNRVCDDIADNATDVLNVINSICDDSKFLEVQSGFAKNIVIGFGRVGGRACGIIANQPACLDGKLNGDATDKASRFVRFCDAFNIPLITLVDCAGFVAEALEEYGGIAKKGARLLHAYTDATVPKISVVIGNSFGGAGLAMGAASDISMAWDCSKIAITFPKVAVNVLYRDEIAEADDPVKFREDKLNEYLATSALPEEAAKSSFIDVVIKPFDTRKCIISALELYASKREIKILRRKHGNMPI